MKINNQFVSVSFFLIFVLGLTSHGIAQRNVDYRSLIMRSQQQQPVSFDFITLPGDKGNTVQFTSVFSFSYSYLPFKKNDQGSAGKEYFSTVNLSMEVFKARKSANQKENRDDNISVEGLEPAGRAFWSDTAFAKSYDESQSNEAFLNGHLDVNLGPGTYNYVLQMARGEQTENRLSRTQVVSIESYDKMQTGNVILGERLITNHQPERLQLSNMGDDVKYTKDFYALTYIPQYEKEANYTLTINSLNVSKRDTSKQSQIFTKALSGEDFRTDLRPKLTTTEGKNYLDLRPSDNGFAYALLKIPNSNFPNSLYRLTIEKEGGKQPVAQDTFRSVWIDMPASLLNLDVAIDMLHYIADEETMDRLSSGSQAEREQKFREYWKERDPTPQTEFNELMAEYYRRIDYAFKNFTTENRLGYESDQGKIYIKYGPPLDIERKFPANGPTTEVWTYRDRTFIFRATTGFGDFRLVSNQSK